MFKITCICLLAALLACVHADNIDRDAQALRFDVHDADAEGNYNYAFETSNGIKQQEAGNANGVAGEVYYVSPEGQPISLSYTADENGYHPTGDHLPTPPPIPPAILRLLEYLRTHAPQQA